MTRSETAPNGVQPENGQMKRVASGTLETVVDFAAGVASLGAGIREYGEVFLDNTGPVGTTVNRVRNAAIAFLEGSSRGSYYGNRNTEMDAREKHLGWRGSEHKYTMPGNKK